MDGRDYGMFEKFEFVGNLFCVDIAESVAVDYFYSYLVYDRDTNTY
jgi:hypothetical protein